MDRLQNTVSLLVDSRHPLACRATPGQEDDPLCAYTGDKVNGPLGETLPATLRMGVCVVSSDSETGIEQEHPLLGPGSEQPSAVGGLLEGRIVVLQGKVDVLERRGSWRRRAYGEAEAVSLAVVVVRVLAYDDRLDLVQWRVPRPVQARELAS